MHSRIESLEENSITLIPSKLGRLIEIGNHTGPDGGMGIDGHYLDDDGLRALLDIIHCHLATGSFAALSDESAVPFVGKQVKLEGKVITVVALEKRCEAHSEVKYMSHQGYLSMSCHRNNLLPLTPPKRVRAYTAKEMTDHFGREFIMADTESVRCRVRNVWPRGVGYCVNGLNSSDEPIIGLDAMSQHCTWADDGSPCGILE